VKPSKDLSSVEPSSDEDFNIKVTVRNGRLLKAIRSRYRSVADLARQCHLHQSRVNSLVTMQLKPFNKNGWTDLALDVAAMVGEEPEDLWPDHLREFKLTKSTSEMEIDLDSVKKIIQDGNSEKSLSQLSAISKFSSNLTPRERDVVSMRFAMKATLEETAEAFDITRERARQIEAKAIRKMRKKANLDGYLTAEEGAAAKQGWGAWNPEHHQTLTKKGIDLLSD